MLFVLQNIFLSVKIDFLQEENTKEEWRVHLTSQRSKHNFPRLTVRNLLATRRVIMNFTLLQIRENRRKILLIVNIVTKNQ